MACGDDRKIVEIMRSAPSREVPTPGQHVQQLLLSNNDKVRFAGTAEGLQTLLQHCCNTAATLLQHCRNTNF